MRFPALLNRLDKLGQALRSWRLSRALLFHRVLAGAEHRNVLSRNLGTVVDVGANRGQFALAIRRWAPNAQVVSFEPQDGPAQVFRKVFSGDERVVLHQCAIGPVAMRKTMHVSARDDSSSLLPISSAQTRMFPGTEEVATTEVRVAPLDEFVNADDLLMPAMLKLDVQGFEFDALRGCESLLECFDWVYCECSFVELYSGQQLASQVIDWLVARGYVLAEMHNPAYDDCGQAIQADLLFGRPSGRSQAK